jgi:hypothetical protein
MPQLILAALTLIILFVEIMLEFSKENKNLRTNFCEGK